MGTRSPFLRIATALNGQQEKESSLTASWGTVGLAEVSRRIEVNQQVQWPALQISGI